MNNTYIVIAGATHLSPSLSLCVQDVCIECSDLQWFVSKDTLMCTLQCAVLRNGLTALRRIKYEFAFRLFVILLLTVDLLCLT